MKQCILSESRFDFLKELVASLPDVVTSDYDEAVMSPQIGSTNSSDGPRSYSRRVEKQTPNPVPAKEAPDGSLRASFATTSSTVVADFYKETLNNTNSSGSVSSGFNNAKDLVPNESEDLDEDYDTT
ncbi:Protein of unknown function [Gryllus bimaculatus]|nr:Protein of unknown function [Gryllus bimaculatus]